MKRPKFIACRYRAVVNGWTCEIFMSGSGGWWLEIYDALGSRGKIVDGRIASQFHSLDAAEKMAVRIALEKNP